MTVEQAFQEAGFTTLAFNFRGSEERGNSCEGRTELADVTGALTCLEKTLGGRPQKFAVAGVFLRELRGKPWSPPRIGAWASTSGWRRL